MNRRKVSISLMLLTIGVIVAFQVYWLRKNYTEEQKTFTIRTNLLFRETVLKMQASQLHLDTTFGTRVPDKFGIINMTNILKEKVIRDTTDRPHQEKAFILSIRRDKPPGQQGQPDQSDSLEDVVYKRASDKVSDFLAGMDSLQGHITTQGITVLYKKVLDKEGIRLPFRITKVPGATTVNFSRGLPGSGTGGGNGTNSGPVRDSTGNWITDTIVDLRKSAGAGANHSPAGFPKLTFRIGNSHREDFFPDSNANRVSVGFLHPVIFQLDFDHPFWYMARRIGPQALFSFVLVGLTTLSFLWLYRNWLQQRRLIELKNDFIGNMTHELKTPIATVSVAVEALQHFNALQDPVKTREYLDISASELQRLSLLVDKVLKLSLYEKQAIELKNDYFDLKTLVEEVMDSMRLQFEKFRARLHVGTEGTDFSLHADKLHITSVLFNLLDNALKYSQQLPYIRVDVVAEPEQLILSVTDNGIGIPAAYQAKIFEKFFRVPTGDHHNVKGYGLGLSYASYVLQRQGGRISVESQEGAGSRFTIKIPRNHA